MCGLAGMMGNGIVQNDLKAFAQLLYVTALRGQDSTGLYTVDTVTGRSRLHKEAVSADYFIWGDNFRKRNMLSSMIMNVFMGHCRSATLGSVNDANAHPFDTGKFVSCHNGTLDGKEWKDKHKTDSEMMFEKMEVEGIDKVLEGINDKSAFAVTMWDKSRRVMTFVRNTERPLWFGFNKDRDVLYWASEKSMLEFVATRCKLNLEYRYAATGVAYEVQMGDIKKGVCEIFTTRKLTFPEPYDWTNYRSYPQQSSTVVKHPGVPKGNTRKVNPSAPKITKVHTQSAPSHIRPSIQTQSNPQTKYKCEGCQEEYVARKIQHSEYSKDGKKSAHICLDCAEWCDGADPDTKALRLKVYS